MAVSVAILFGVLCIGALLWAPFVKAHPTWRAMITPLASIIGSGFLVLGPILQVEYGSYAPAVLLGLCVVAYALGGAIRANIAARAAGHRLPAALEGVSSAVLAFAYVISVAYYLNLFGAFAVSLTPFDDETSARLVTSAVFVLILLVGWVSGFTSLERLEYVSVTIKLAIIAGMFIGLAVFFGQTWQAGDLYFEPAHRSGWGALTLAFGLIVTVQGFETSRYLGAQYPAQTRIKSMRLAQLFSTAIYLVYIGLIAYALPAPDGAISETAIVEMMRVVAPVLPALLVAAALAAQFSAAVADTGGSGGLIHELSRGKVSPRAGYLVLVGIGLTLTWSADVFEIIAYASRAFALYYALQAIQAAGSKLRQGQWEAAAAFLMLALLALSIAVFGQAIEG